jgi:hypothetical protein
MRKKNITVLGKNDNLSPQILNEELFLFEEGLFPSIFPQELLVQKS